MNPNDLVSKQFVGLKHTYIYLIKLIFSELIFTKMETYLIPVLPSPSVLSRGNSGMHSKNRSKMATALSLTKLAKICNGFRPKNIKIINI